jgi:hypothetical protein
MPRYRVPESRISERSFMWRLEVVGALADAKVLAIDNACEANVSASDQRPHPPPTHPPT